MTDTSALAAIVAAAVALFMATAQVAQQLLAPAYVVRKCDRIVTGGFTQGGKRQWQWRQFRLNVKYQAVVFALVQSVHKGLSRLHRPVHSYLEGDTGPDAEDKAAPKVGPRMLGFSCHPMVSYSRYVCTRKESGDWTPEDDPTAAPLRLDLITILLTCITISMHVVKFSPSTGKPLFLVALAASPRQYIVLKGDYSAKASSSASGMEATKYHGHALRSVWANAVLGRFRGGSFRP